MKQTTSEDMIQNHIVSEVEMHYKCRIPKSERQKVRSSKEAFNVAMTIYDKGLIGYREMLIAIYLNGGSEVLGYTIIGKGGTCFAPADPKLIFQAALLANAQAFVLVHNHPSGKLNPSKEDKAITQRVAQAGQFLGIQLLDHIIICDDDEEYYSMKDNAEF